MFVKVEDNDWFFNKLTDASLAPPSLEDKAGIIVKLFDAGVDTLRNPKEMPNLAINKLMTIVWHLVGNKITPAAIIGKMPLGRPETLHFWCEINPDNKSMGIVLIPFDWDKMYVDNPYMQLGGLVFTASQCADYAHKKFVSMNEEPIIARARAYESEYLLTVLKELKIELNLNDYQREILDHYPKGLESLDPSLRYELQSWTENDYLMLKASLT